ncbi:MAG: hypothetical protein ABSB69_11055, partial [Solirubrobacteraceae bacterium]
MSRGVTEKLARACAAHPRRTLGAWALALFAALALVATSLHGLSSSYHVVGKPESARAADALAKAFPAGSSNAPAGDASDIVIVHSSLHTVTAPAFRAFVTDFVQAVRATGAATEVRSYLSVGRPLVSADGHATLIALSASSTSKVKPIVALVEHDRAPGFTISITGSYPAQNDFSKLSQSDLEHGELAFGLP